MLGLDFLSFAKIQLDFATFSFSFAFDKSRRYDFVPVDVSSMHSQCFPSTEEAWKEVVAGTWSLCVSESRKLDQLGRDFPKLFSDQLGTVKGMVCQLDLIDDLPVRSRPYQCSP
jgi:hypothetical protein